MTKWEEKIISKFYDQIVPTLASDKPLYIEDWKFLLHFNTIIVDQEKIYRSPDTDITLYIKNKKEFDNLLVEYTIKQINQILNNDQLKEKDDLYFDGNIESMMASITSRVWSNATEEDFKDPITFLKRRIDFLENDFCNEQIEKEKKSEPFTEDSSMYLSGKITLQNPLALETPFVFKSKIVSLNNEGQLLLPSISFGLSEDTCYIYSIKGERKINLDKSEKKINRLLYKANKKIEDDRTEENIKEVSPSQLFATSAFLKMLEEAKIEKIVVKNYYPLRMMAKEKILEEKKKNLDLLQSKQEIEKLERTNQTLSENIHNKYLRIFSRLEQHFSNLHIVSYPYELDNSLHLKLFPRKEKTKEENILEDVYGKFSFGENEKKNKK